MDQPKTPFERTLTEQYARPEISARTDVRWWMAAGMHTDETIREELDAMYEAGFGGVELCQLRDKNIDETVYGYGGAQWKNDVRLILDTALARGMSVSLTSGAGWATANVPGLDPDSQAANQCVVLVTEEAEAGSRRTGPLPKSGALREKAVLVGVTAIRRVGDKTYDPDRTLVLTASVKDGALDWTAPEDGPYTLMTYYAQGTAQACSPAVRTSNTVNYFDRRGVGALQEYLEKNVLDDEALNAKIRSGDVQLFMDSLEYSHGAGITNWTENFVSDFRARKGYDVLPYLFLAAGTQLSDIWRWDGNADL